MICQNYSYALALSGSNYGGVTSPNQFFNSCSVRGWFTRLEYDPNITNQLKRDSFPTGTQPPYSYIMGPSGGMLTASTTINGTTSVSSSVSLGKNMSSSMSGLGELSANAKLVVSLATSVSGTGSLTASLVGTIALQAALTGSGSVTAGLNLIAFMIANPSGSGSISADLKGKLKMEADIYVNQSEFTVNQLVAGIWNAVASEYNTSGTMGELLNGAGGGATPSVIADAVWDEILSAHNISGSTGEKLSKLLEKIQFLYLKD